MLGFVLLLVAGSAKAQVPAEQFGDSIIQDVRLMYTPDDGLYLYATSVLILPPSVLEALEQGIPVYFVAEASMTRTRWWLLTREDVHQQRFWRLSYQPLTRKWRVQTSGVSSADTDQSLGFAQIFDSASDALSTIQRINSWKIADAGQLKSGAHYEVEFTLGLDRSRVPRPLQISELGKPFGDLQLEWRQDFPMPQ